MVLPIQCHLWKKKVVTNKDLNQDNFELLEIFEDDSHLIRKLLKCKDYSHLYFYEFYEEIDWKNGNDPQYRTYIPVNTKKEAREIAKLTPIGILKYSPRLQKDWPSNLKRPVIHWIGKSHQEKK